MKIIDQKGGKSKKKKKENASKWKIPLLTLYLPHYESQYLVHLQILIKIAQETSSFHTYGVNDLLDLPGEHCVKRRIRRD